MADTQDEAGRMALLFWDWHGLDAIAAALKLAKDMHESDKLEEADFWLRVSAELQVIRQRRNERGGS